MKEYYSDFDQILLAGINYELRMLQKQMLEREFRLMPDLREYVVMDGFGSLLPHQVTDSVKQTGK